MMARYILHVKTKILKFAMVGSVCGFFFHTGVVFSQSVPAHPPVGPVRVAPELVRRRLEEMRRAGAGPMRRYSPQDEALIRAMFGIPPARDPNANRPTPSTIEHYLRPVEGAESPRPVEPRVEQQPQPPVGASARPQPPLPPLPTSGPHTSDSGAAIRALRAQIAIEPDGEFKEFMLDTLAKLEGQQR